MYIGNNSVLGTKKTIRKAWVLFSITLFFVFLSFGYYASATTVWTYDDFSSGSIDADKWKLNDNNNFFSVSSGVPHVLHASGSGSTSFPGANLTTLPSYHPFSGYFGAGINFFSFSQSGYTPAPGSSEPYPSIGLMIGDWGALGPGTGPFERLFSRCAGSKPQR